MPFRLAITKLDVKSALTEQGYTSARAPSLDKLDANITTRAAPGDILQNPANKVDGSRIDANISSRAAPGAQMDITSGAETKVKSQAQSALTDQGYTPARAAKVDNLDTAVSSRAAPGAEMGIIAAARAAIWNELVPGTPTSGSYGEKVKGNLDAAVSSRADGSEYNATRAAKLDNVDVAVSSRAAPGAQMDLNSGAETKVKNQAKTALTDQGYTTARSPKLDNLDAAVGSRATPTDVDTKLSDRGITSARMAKMDMVASQAQASDAIAAGSNTSGLTVTLDTGGGTNQARAVVEVRYSCGAAAELYAEGSDDNVNWYEGDHISEDAATTDRLVGYLNAHRYFRFRSPTTGIDLSFNIKALL